MDVSARSPPKTTLFCQACGFRADVDEWSTVETGARRDVACPACGSVAVSQPLFCLPA